MNPPAVLRWNSDKIYLRDLADAGVPTVPTSWVALGQVLGLPLGEFVVKPAEGAGSMGAGRFARRPSEARRHVEALHRPVASCWSSRISPTSKPVKRR